MSGESRQQQMMSQLMYEVRGLKIQISSLVEDRDEYKRRYEEMVLRYDELSKDFKFYADRATNVFETLKDRILSLERELSRFQRPLVDRDPNLYKENVPPFNDEIHSEISARVDTIMEEKFFQCSDCGNGLYASQQEFNEDWEHHKHICGCCDEEDDK